LRLPTANGAARQFLGTARAAQETVTQNKRTHEQKTVTSEAANRSGHQGAKAVVLNTAPGAVNVAPTHHQHLIPRSKAKDGVSQTTPFPCGLVARFVEHEGISQHNSSRLVGVVESKRLT
jgi:hypothetical protein